MKKQNDLYDLIHSLTKQEKRYFKLYSSIHSKGKEISYIKIFDILEKQPIYEGKKLAKLLANEKFAGHLAVVKNYLYYSILRSLEHYHQSTDAELRGMLNQINILFNKELYAQSKKLIQKAMLLAVKAEKHLVILELKEIEARIMQTLSYSGNNIAELENYKTEVHNSVNKHINTVSYNYLRMKLFYHINKYGFAREKSLQKKYNSIMQHPLLNKKENILSGQSLNLYYLCHGTYYYVQQNYAKAYPYVKHRVHILESHSHLAEENPRTYIGALSNLINCQRELKKNNELKESLKKLQNINKTTFVLYSVYNQTLSILLSTAQFMEGLNVIKEIENTILKTQSGFLNNKEKEMNLYYKMAYVLFGAQKYKEANAYLNKIIQDKDMESSRLDGYCFARILSLITQFEMGKQDLLEYSIKWTYRFLYNRKHLYKTERHILDFLRNESSHINNNSDMIRAFKKLKAELEQLNIFPFEKRVASYFDFISWLESKINNKTFADVLTKKLAH